MGTPTKTEEAPKDFADVLTEISHGQLHERLTKELQEIVAAVAETGNDGKLTLTLNVTHEGTMVMLSGKVKAEIPKHAIPGSLFFAEDGQLFRDDPRQLKLRNVKPAPAPDNVRSLPSTRQATARGPVEVIPQRAAPTGDDAAEEDPGDDDKPEDVKH